MNAEALIVAGVRTPIGSLGGALSTVPAMELGATCVKAVLEKAKIPPDDVDEVIMGNVVGTAWARTRHARQPSKPDYPFRSALPQLTRSAVQA